MDSPCPVVRLPESFFATMEVIWSMLEGMFLAVLILKKGMVLGMQSQRARILEPIVLILFQCTIPFSVVFANHILKTKFSYQKPNPLVHRYLFLFQKSFKICEFYTPVLRIRKLAISRNNKKRNIGEFCSFYSILLCRYFSRNKATVASFVLLEMRELVLKHDVHLFVVRRVLSSTKKYIRYQLDQKKLHLRKSKCR